MSPCRASFCSRPREQGGGLFRPGPSAAWRGRLPACRASVLIIVMWVAFGLVSLTLYFAHTMSMELRSADNRSAALEAEQAIAGAVRYVSNVLATAEEPGRLPDLLAYRCEAVPVGDALFWIIGRSTEDVAQREPVFGLVDEGGKLNLNTATLEMLQMLPRMTPELAAAIIDWRDSDSDETSGGAEDTTYMRLPTPYRCKNANFESVQELRLVYGADLGILFGEDTNLNGALDPNENDGDVSLPSDNRDGRLDPGIIEYFTVYTAQSTNAPDGTARIDVAGTGDTAPLQTLLQEKLSSDRATQILRQLTGQMPRSLLEFFILSGMTEDEFSRVADNLTVSTGSTNRCVVNVNAAPEPVLACIPGIGTDNAPTLVSYRRGNTDKLTSVAWVASVIDRTNAVQAGPYLAGKSYLFGADIAAVGHHGRGYRRQRYLFDTSTGTPKVVHVQDLTHRGWALGREARHPLLAQRNPLTSTWAH